MRIISGLKEVLVNNFGFFIVACFVLAISIKSIKPTYDFAGWDNYSSYLDAPLNLWRTFFSAWRERRGMGIASDSEVADLPRLIFYAVLGLLLNRQLLDQVYYLTSFGLGVFFMFQLSRVVFERYLAKLSVFKSTRKNFYSQLFSLCASLIYIFNLNTLAVFYFPIMPYVPRFFAIPLTFWFFIKFTTSKHLSRKWFFVSAASLLFSTTSYVIGTNFVTLCLTLGILFLFSKNKKSYVLCAVILLLINSYWLLNFANYTIQKSSIIRLASTFIAANETQQNKPAEFYSLKNQLLMLPNFFETKYLDTKDNTSKPLHPLSDLAQNNAIIMASLLIPVILSAIGILIMAFHYRKIRSLFWVPITYFLALVFCMKEYSYLGTLYAIIVKYIPTLDVLFRFADTKIHPYIALTSSLLVSIAVVFFVSKVNNYTRKIRVVFSVTSIVLFLFILAPYKSYFDGNFVGFFGYTKIPTAYFKLAKKINAVDGSGRVLQLPYDETAYWRSYSWGYLGSEFFGFMINKPLLDKTHEPASMENRYILKNIYDMYAKLDSNSNIEASKSSKFCLQIAQPLKNAGVQFIVLDETISSDVPQHNAAYWYGLDVQKSRQLVTLLTACGHLQVFDEQPAFTDAKGSKQSLKTYSLINNTPKILFHKNSISLDPKLSNSAELPLPPNKTYINALDSGNKIYYPIQDKFSKPTQSKLGFDFDVGQRGVNKITTEESLDEIPIKVTLFRAKDRLFIKLYKYLGPLMDGVESTVLILTMNTEITHYNKLENVNYFVSDFEVQPNSISTLRVRIGSLFVPVPYTDKTNTEIQVADIIISKKDNLVGIYTLKQIHELKTSNITPTSNVNCLNDKKEGYAYDYAKNTSGFSMHSASGSVCAWTQTTELDVDHYSEIALGISGFSNKQRSDVSSIWKPNLANQLTTLSAALYLHVCFQADTTGCTNKHDVLRLHNNEKTYLVPSEKLLTKESTITALFATKNNFDQQVGTNISSIQELVFTNVNEYITVDFELYTRKQPAQYLSSAKTLKVPRFVSNYSFYFNIEFDGLESSGDTCGNQNNSRAFGYDVNTIIFYAKGCENFISKRLSFAGTNSIILATKINLLSGQYPKFTISDKFSSFHSNIIGLYQGYPDINGFKQLQQPEGYISHLPKIHGVKTTLFTELISNKISHNNKSKEFAVKQYSENDGLIALDRFDVVDIPVSWVDLAIETGRADAKYAIPLLHKFKQVSPGEWTVDAALEPGKTYLLEFNEGFDKQWLLKGVNNKHTQCNGLSNCFILYPKKSNYRLTIIFWPQYLQYAGYVVLVLTLLGIIFWPKGKIERF